MPLLPSVQERAEGIVGDLYSALSYRDVQIKILRVRLRPCPLCKGDEVGRIDYEVSYRYSAASPVRWLINVNQQYNRKDKILFGVAVICVDGGRICRECEKKFRRTPPSKLRRESREERAHNRAYVRFLAGEIWPEINVAIKSADGHVWGRTENLKRQTNA